MKNNGSGKDDDDFWKILSESDSEYESEIGLLFKPKRNVECPRPEIKDGIQKVEGSDESKKDAPEENSEEVVCERMNDFQESGRDKRKDENIEEVQAYREEEKDKSLGEEEPEDDKGNDEVENTHDKGTGLKSEVNTTSGILSEAGPKVSSVDEMDFLWDDDDDEEFIVGEVTNMNIEKGPSNDEDDFKSTTDSLKHASYVAEEHVKKDEEEQEDSMEHEKPDSEDSVTKPPLKPLNSKMDPMKPKPLARFVCGSLLTVFMSSQKRFNMQGEAIQNYINISQWYRLDYVLPDIKPSNFIASRNNRDDRYQHVYELIQLKTPSIDSITSIVSTSRPAYCSRDINRSVSAENMNKLIGLCMEDPDKALEYAIENEIWEAGILLSKWTKDIGNRFLEKYCDSPYAQLISSALGFSRCPFKFHGDWKKYIREVLSTRNADVNNDFIMQVFGVSVPDALFVVLASYFLGVIDINKYLWMFSKNFEVLNILCYVEYTGRSVKDIDILKYEFVSTGIEFDRTKAEEYFKANRKCFRKELGGDLDSVFETRWSFGLKSVFDFGIKKILNVDSLEDDPKKIEAPVSSDVSLEATSQELASRCDLGSRIPSLSSKSDAMLSISDSKVIGIDAKFEKREAVNEVLKVEESGKPSAGEYEQILKVSEIKKNGIYSLPQEEILLKHDEGETKAKDEELSVNSMPCDIKERNNLYMDTKQSKSFADFFEGNKREEEVRSEDDTSLFLSRFIDDEPSDPGTKKKEQKKSGSFFGFLNVFKKEPVHKAKIDIDDDFRYDPVEKKWVGGTSNESKKGDSPVLKPREIPKPKMGMGIPTKGGLDMNVTSMYANRKSAGNKSIPGVLSKKE
ncbi:hypothetical protein EROM_090140 [Encephalitozoon romaleae SJ-2008]|uniref:Uncharacterized protein n=1 Tax=Encephalitozoon romaleae (strain SJ-2008) TaxID=1178016 RepID=I7AT88_ENCRO|nr:hypothetical protein EROM_090140 [Encephalitozoon romaleae SJ-2008]AFN83632.1 hypothetical protein EROM_090140 [Encephalitozoon romaleae SJ-2008]